MIMSKLERAELEDNKCLGQYKFGQCPYKPVEKTNFCQMHNGNFIAYQINNKEMFQYRVERWRNQINHFANDDEIKSIRQEIGVARMLLEETLNKCEDANELMLYSTKIITMVSEINKLVISCTKLEDRLGVVIDKSTVLNLGNQILETIKEHLPQDKFELIANQIIQTIAAAGDPLALESD